MRRNIDLGDLSEIRAFGISVQIVEKGRIRHDVEKECGVVVCAFEAIEAVKVELVVVGRKVVECEIRVFGGEFERFVQNVIDGEDIMRVAD